MCSPPPPPWQPPPPPPKGEKWKPIKPPVRLPELIERREHAAAAEALACRSLADAMKPRGADAAAVPAWRWCEYKEEPR